VSEEKLFADIALGDCRSAVCASAKRELSVGLRLNATID
jgi:hypothetical protein